VAGVHLLADPNPHIVGIHSTRSSGVDQITLDTYSHVMPGMEVDAAAEIGR
jgi:hypothetical protein